MADQIVEVPGMGRVAFPEGMSRDEIAAVIKKNSIRPKETPSGSGNWATTALARAGTGLAGAPGDVMSLIGQAPAAVLNKMSEIRSRVHDDVPRVNFRPVTTETGYGSQMLTKGVENVTGPLYKPTGTGERYGAAVVEGAAAGSPGGVPGMVMGAVSGASGELADQLFPGNPYSRLVGNLVGAGGTGIAQSIRRPAGAVIDDALKGVDPATLDRAQALITEARARGITLTGPEAIAQMQGTANAPITNIQRIVEQSRGGGPVMSGVLSQRPAENRQAFTGVLNQVGPQVADPTAIAPRIQTAATDVVDSARQAGNTAARPFYQAAETQRVPASTWNSAVSDPAIAAALQRVKRDPLLRLQNETEGSVRWLDAAKKYLDEAANPNLTATALERTGAANAAGAARDVRSGVDAVVPAYQRARGIVEQNMENVVKPLERQPIGQLANADTFAKQKAILFPANPETLTPQAVRQTISQLRMRDPTAAQDLTRQFLQTQFDEATQKLIKGQNEWGGAKFSSIIMGNDQQAKNLRAAIEALPNGKQALPGFNKFIEIMEAQGKRQPAGSMTEFNKQGTAELSRGGIVGGAVSTATSPSKLTSVARDWWERFQYGKNSEELARIFTDPQSVTKMRQLAMMDKGSATAQALAISIIQGNPQQEANK